MRAASSAPTAEDRNEVLGPYISAVEPLDVWSASTVVEKSEPSVMDEPGVRVWPDMTYSDSEFGVMVSLLRMIEAGALASGVNPLRTDVVTI